MKKLLLVLLFLVPTIVMAQADGDLVKSTTSDQVYLIRNSHKHWIKNPDIFNSYKFDWGKIKIIGQKEIDNIPEANVVKASTDSKVYSITNNKMKSWITTAEVFEGKGYKWSDIVEISQFDLDSYQLAGDIKMFDQAKSKVKITSTDPILNTESMGGKFKTTEVKIMKINFEAAGPEKINISKIIINQSGSFNDLDYSNAWIVSDKDGKMWKGDGPKGMAITFNMSADPIILSANTNDVFVDAGTYNVFVDFENSVNGKNFKFSMGEIEMKGAETGINIPIQKVTNLMTKTHYISEVK